MSRFSPTVAANYGPGLGEGLLNAVGQFDAERDRKRAAARQKDQDTMAHDRFADEMKSSAIARQLQTLQVQEAQGRAADTAGLGAIRAAGEARSLGYERSGGTPSVTMAAPQVAPLDGSPAAPSNATVTINGTPSVYRQNAALMPETQREGFARLLAAQTATITGENARSAATTAGENTRNTATIAGENTRNTATIAGERERTDMTGAAQRDVARIGATSREAVAVTNHPLNQGTSIGALSKMNPEAKRRHFANVATQAIEAADNQLPPGDTVTIDGKSYARADGIRQMGVRQIIHDPDTKDYFSYGMSEDDLNAAMQKYAERPAARATAKADKEADMTDRLMHRGKYAPGAAQGGGGATVAPTATGTAAPSARAAWGAAHPPLPNETRDQYKARGDAATR